MTSRKEQSKIREVPKEIPDIVVDPATRKRYMKGRFLGKGGFARCYELTDMETKQLFAGKIVAKTLLQKQHQKDKMTQEIAIHRSVAHRHIVQFHSFFEDNDNVYILLELCRRRSLMELHKRRREVTEPEVRYFVRHVVQACDYLHKNHIIHRDLKLGNLFLNDEMEVKIGDFGLATRVEREGERKRTLCGTPNYIAPEVLGKKGHSYEVDAWSLGCIVYTLLVGKPPFETKCLKDTYQKIKDNDYELKPKLSPEAKNLIKRLLRSDPSSRPTMEQILQDEFFTCGFLPAGLPTSCLTMAPRFDTLRYVQDHSRKALMEINGTDGKSRMPSAVRKEEGKEAKPDSTKRTEGDCYLADLFAQLTQLIAALPADRIASHAQIVADYGGEDPAEDPSCIPIYWVSKWVDYSDKYGLGYQLCDNSIGVLFNDTTRLLLAVNGENIQYIERDGLEHFHTIKQYPENLSKKITLLKYFRSYMNEHLLKAGADVKPREGDEMTRLPFLKTWFRTRNAMVLHLSNGTLQVNFFHDHTKIIICPLMQAVTYIDEKKVFRVFRLKLCEKYGCSKELASRLRYACTMVERLLTPRSGSSSSASAAGSLRQKSAPAASGAGGYLAAAGRPTSAQSQHSAGHHTARSTYHNHMS